MNRKFVIYIYSYIYQNLNIFSFLYNVFGSAVFRSIFYQTDDSNLVNFQKRIFDLNSLHRIAFKYKLLAVIALNQN